MALLAIYDDLAPTDDIASKIVTVYLIYRFIFLFCFCWHYLLVSFHTESAILKWLSDVETREESTISWGIHLCPSSWIWLVPLAQKKKHAHIRWRHNWFQRSTLPSTRTACFFTWYLVPALSYMLKNLENFCRNFPYRVVWHVDHECDIEL